MKKALVLLSCLFVCNAFAEGGDANNDTGIACNIHTKEGITYDNIQQALFLKGGGFKYWRKKLSIPCPSGTKMHQDGGCIVKSESPIDRINGDNVEKQIEDINAYYKKNSKAIDSVRLYCMKGFSDDDKDPYNYSSYVIGYICEPKYDAGEKLYAELFKECVAGTKLTNGCTLEFKRDKKLKNVTSGYLNGLSTVWFNDDRVVEYDSDGNAVSYYDTDLFDLQNLETVDGKDVILPDMSDAVGAYFSCDKTKFADNYFALDCKTTHTGGMYIIYTDESGREKRLYNKCVKNTSDVPPVNNVSLVVTDPVEVTVPVNNNDPTVTNGPNTVVVSGDNTTVTDEPNTVVVSGDNPGDVVTVTPVEGGAGDPAGGTVVATTGSTVTSVSLPSGSICHGSACFDPNVFTQMNQMLQNYFTDGSAWKKADGSFNTTRLIADSAAGVVLGTAGGIITSRIVKKNQIENGLEKFKCTIDGQDVARYGDRFSVGWTE